jgi:NAD(P)-dependent dehydrogenase (short-subunit alcohol dehydrogenase family)
LGRLDGRLALITGASRGLGAALAERFAGEGARLILVARSVGGLEEVDDRVRAAGGEATLVPQDLTKSEAIDQLGAAVELAALSPLAHVDPKTFEGTLAINAVANYRLIRSLDPLLRASAAGSAIFVTADVGAVPRAFFGAYAASKAALESLAMTYAAETAKTSLRVNLVDPGPMRTRLRAKAYPGEDKEKLAWPAERAELFVELAEAGCARHGERLKTY